MENNFNKLNLDSNIVLGLEKQVITTPTEIQSLAIPNVLENKDIIAEAYTGSGKTLAFVAPLFQKIDTSKRESQVLILAPTHELVIQITEQIKLLAKNSEIPVTSLSIIGEASIEKQIKKIKETKPHIVVGSAGRILDLIKKKKFKPHTLKTIVIDEADSLLVEEKIAPIKEIIKTTMRDRQLMTFSATINNKVLTSAKELMKDPVILKSEAKVSLNPNITHMCILSERKDKFETLRKLINATKPKKAIVFLNKGHEIEFITQKLNYHKKNAIGIYGNMTKEQRKNALDGFRHGKYNILVSSDLAARGLDIADVTHIFNLDFPVKAKEYLHRAGRTARGNASGTCISIVNERDLAAIRIYEREFNIEIEPKVLFEGKLYNPKDL